MLKLNEGMVKALRWAVLIGGGLTAAVITIIGGFMMWWVLGLIALGFWLTVLIAIMIYDVEYREV